VRREPMDLAAYEARARRGPCFVCAFLARDPRYGHELVFDDGDHVAFLDRYPTLPGRTIVAPRAHVEHLFRDLDHDAYLRLQDVVYRVARAVERAVASERTYVLSLGSQQGNSHVHWMVAPLPPGTPYEHQQYHALMAENGTVAMSRAEVSALADRIRAHL
jgi:histidine triad (HIT) family protein